MIRGLRIIAHVLTLTVCLVFLGACALAGYQWVHGYKVVDVWERDDRVTRDGKFTDTVFRVSSGRGVLALNYTRRSSPCELEVIYVRTGRGRFTTAPSPIPGDSWFRNYTRSSLRPDQLQLHSHSIWQEIGFNADFRDGAQRYPSRGAASPQRRRWQARVPYWFIVVVTGVPPVLYLRRLRVLRRRSRSRRGLCPGCGYDVRASRERCPECGETIDPVAAAAAPSLVPTGVTT